MNRETNNHDIAHVIAFSGGKDSTAMTLRLHELHPEIDFEVIATPVGNEPDEVFDHIERIGEMIGKPIRQIRLFPDGDGLPQLIIDQGMIPNFRARFCTRMLKIEPMQEYLKSIVPCVHYVGLRADEVADPGEKPKRIGMYDDIEGIEHRHPMKEWGWNLPEVQEYLASRGVTVPRRTDCEWCFYQKLSEWKRLWRKNPESFERAAEIEREMGHTFRSPGRDTWPASLDELAQAFATGRKVQGHSYHRQELLFPAEYSNCDQDEACRVCSM